MSAVNPRDREHVLQLGPLWILSALTGTSSYFSELDRQALADAVLDTSRRTPPPARALLESIVDAGDELFWDFELDERSVVAGLWDVVAVLRDADAEYAADVKLALLRIGVAVAKARGPYGRTVTAQGEQQLRLIAELLELRDRAA